MNTLKSKSSSFMVINRKNLIEKNNIYRNENDNVTKKKNLCCKINVSQLHLGNNCIKEI